MNYLYGITDVYNSAEASGFDDESNYPIAWEVIAIHNAAGKTFVQSIRAAFKKVDRSEGYVVNLDAGTEDPMLCLMCVFRDKASFRNVLDTCMADVVIYDEHRKSPVLKPTLLEDSEALLPLTQPV